MTINNRTMALVAHDNKKKALIEWVLENKEILKQFDLICTGTTGKLVEEAMNKDILSKDKIKISKLKSGPLGGDQQLGAMICEGKIDLLIFLWDPMQPQPHDVDVKALLRISSLYNVPCACNRSTADYMISSSLLFSGYKPKVSEFSDYLTRDLSETK